MLEKLVLAAAITLSANLFLDIQSPASTSGVSASRLPETSNLNQNQLMPSQPLLFPPLAIQGFSQSE